MNRIDKLLMQQYIKLQLSQNKNIKTNSIAPERGRKKDGTMVFAINSGWAYELVPCSDEAILAIDEELKLL